MGKGKQYEGVRARGSSIQIDFRHKGKRCRETISIEPSPTNLKNAANLRGEILNKIALNQFDYSEYFPNSKNASSSATPKTRACSFAQYSQLFLDSLEVEEGTRRQYSNQISNRWIPIFGDRDLRSIKYSEIASIIGSIEWGSAKTRNNNLIPLRKVFELAFMDGIINTDPMQKIKSAKVQKKPPDPLSTEEVNKVLSYMADNYEPQVTNYFEFAFYTGLRIEELIELRWTDYDMLNNKIRVQRARSYGKIKDTKTNKARDVSLNAKSLTAIHRQKAHTFFRQDSLIFVNPVTDEPWADNHKAQRIRYWNPALKKLGIRFRQQKQTRHTYATMLLMSGVNPAYAARQLGHSVQVFLNVYSAWIDKTGNDAEEDKLSRFLSNGHNVVTNMAK